MFDRYKWTRPQLPSSLSLGETVGLGWFFTVSGLLLSGIGGLLIATHEPSSYIAYADIHIEGNESLVPGIWCAVIGVSFFQLGVVLLGVGSIMREIRRGAFEAALRAGEVRDSHSERESVENGLTR